MTTLSICKLFRRLRLRPSRRRATSRPASVQPLSRWTTPRQLRRPRHGPWRSGGDRWAARRRLVAVVCALGARRANRWRYYAIAILGRSSPLHALTCTRGAKAPPPGTRRDPVGRAVSEPESCKPAWRCAAGRVSFRRAANDAAAGRQRPQMGSWDAGDRRCSGGRAIAA